MPHAAEWGGVLVAACRRMGQRACCRLPQNGARASLPLAAKSGSKEDAASRRPGPQNGNFRFCLVFF